MPTLLSDTITALNLY